MVKIKVFYGDTPLYVADLYQFCITDCYTFTLSDTPFLAHSFPSLESAQSFAEDYLTGRRVIFIEGGYEHDYKNNALTSGAMTLVTLKETGHYISMHD